MQALIEGDKGALSHLMTRYKKPLFHFALRYVRDEDVAYDIVQDAFVRVYERAETYNSAYKFKPWLYRIAINLCRDYGRWKKLRATFSLDRWQERLEASGDAEGLHDLLPHELNEEDAHEHRQTLRALEAEIELLPHKLKTALLLFTLESASYEDCAALLGVTPKTVEMRVYRARQKLREKLADKI